MTPRSSQPLVTLQNQQLHVDIHADAQMVIEHRPTATVWKTANVAIQEKGEVEIGHVWVRGSRTISEQYPGRFQLHPEHTPTTTPVSTSLACCLFAPQQRPVGRFTCRISLEDASIVFQIDAVESSIPSLVFPPPIISDAIILPRGVGEIIRDTTSKMGPRHLLTAFSSLNMRWIGGLLTGGDRSTESHTAPGWIGILDTGFEDAFVSLVNRTATPLWSRSLGEWRHSFTYRMQFLKGGYVALAKAYRRWIQQSGAWVGLTDKVQNQPHLQSLLGGKAFWINCAHPPVRQTTAEELYLTAGQLQGQGTHPLNIHFTFPQLRHLLGQMENAGLQRGLIKIGGWIQGGYDNSHPDVWPPDPRLGDLTELAGLLAHPAPLLVALHDNNQDCYPHTASFPNGVVRNQDGTLMTGGIWAGGQTYILHSRASVHYARRNWESIRTLGPKAMFVDIITAMQLYQTFESGREATKADDLLAKKELMQFYKEQGVLLGSEESGDLGIPWIDWYENRHRRIANASIPLWPLVYHDAAFATRYVDPFSHEQGYPAWLEDILWGYIPHIHITPDVDYTPFIQGLTPVTAWHKRVGLAEMISHRCLDQSGNVEECVFATGDRIVCNFGPTPFHIEGRDLAPASFCQMD